MGSSKSVLHSGNQKKDVKVDAKSGEKQKVVGELGSQQFESAEKGFCDLHKHQLHYQFVYENIGFDCDECKVTYPDQKAYHCQECMFDICVTCFVLHSFDEEKEKPLSPSPTIIVSITSSPTSTIKGPKAGESRKDSKPADLANLSINTPINIPAISNRLSIAIPMHSPIKPLIGGSTPQPSAISANYLHSDDEFKPSSLTTQQQQPPMLREKSEFEEADDGEDLYVEAELAFWNSQYVKAVDLYRKAANLEHIDAQFKLGQCYLDPLLMQKLAAEENIPLEMALQKLGFDSVESQAAEAIALYYRAAAQGLLEAQFELGRWYQCQSEEEQPLAVQWLEKAAQAGHVRACYQLYVCCMEGIGMQQNIEAALQCLSEAARLGNGSACAALGRHYEHGEGVPENKEKAVSLYKLAITRGDWKGYIFLGNACELGIGMEAVDNMFALELYECVIKAEHTTRKFTLAELDSQDSELERSKWSALAVVLPILRATALYRLGCFYQDGTRGVAKNEEKACQFFKEACELVPNPSPSHLAALASFYEHGYGGMAVNTAIAAALYFQAAEGVSLLVNSQKVGRLDPVEEKEELVYLAAASNLGLEVATYELGRRYQEGNICERDIDRAITLFEGISDFLPAKYYLGAAYLEGGVTTAEDQALGKNLIVEAADGGMARAVFRIAEAYEHGLWDCPTDKSKALEGYSQAAELGDELAQFRLGNAYTLGELGLEIAVEKGLALFQQAADSDYEPAMDKLQELEEKEGMEDIDEVNTEEAL